MDLSPGQPSGHYTSRSEGGSAFHGTPVQSEMGRPVMQADAVREWFNSELDRLEKRRERGIFSATQMEVEVDTLIKERDSKLRIAAASASEKGQFRHAKRKRRSDGGTDAAGKVHKGYLSGDSTEGSVFSGGCVKPSSLPSCVTWWIGRRVQRTESSDFSASDEGALEEAEEKPRAKRTADARVAAPGTGKRGREKRTPRQFKFKWDVVLLYERLKMLKADGKMDDPCLVTARLFSINKSQVSAWYSQREAIRNRLGDMADVGFLTPDGQAAYAAVVENPQQINALSVPPPPQPIMSVAMQHHQHHQHHHQQSAPQPPQIYPSSVGHDHSHVSIAHPMDLINQSHHSMDQLQHHAGHHLLQQHNNNIYGQVAAPLPPHQNNNVNSFQDVNTNFQHSNTFQHANNFQQQQQQQQQHFQYLHHYRDA